MLKTAGTYSYHCFKELTKHHVIQTGWSGGVTQRFLNLGNTLKRMASFTSGGPQNRSERCAGDRTSIVQCVACTVLFYTGINVKLMTQIPNSTANITPSP